MKRRSPSARSSGNERLVVCGTALVILLALQVLVGSPALAYQLQFLRAFGVQGTGPSEMYHPWDLEMDINGKIYVADTINNRIQVYNGKGLYLKTIGSGVGEEPGQLHNPESLALDDPDDPSFLYVADTTNHRIQVFDVATGESTQTWGHYGSADGEFNGPSGIAVYGGYVYVTDRGNARVQKFTTAGVFVTKWGSYGTGEGQFFVPAGVSANVEGVYVTDEQAGVQKFTADGGFLQEFGSKGTQEGQLDFPDEISACPALNIGSPLVKIYVAEAGNTQRVSEFDDVGNGGVFSRSFTGSDKGGSTFGYPHGVFCFPDQVQTRVVLVASTNESRIYKFDYGKVEMKINPAELGATLLNRKTFRFKLSHNGMIEKCKLTRSKGYFEIPDGESIGLDDNHVYSVHGPPAGVQPRETRAYEVPLSDSQFDAAKKAVHKHRTIKVVITFHFDDCARGDPITVRYKIG